MKLTDLLSFFSFTSLFLSNLIIFVLMIILATKRIGTKKDYERIWLYSKISTIKNIVNKNHNLQLFYTISSEKNITGLSTNYINLLKLITTDGCVENYRVCGILDTYGNNLCIDETYDCPINEIYADLSSKKDKYLSLNYKIVELDKLTYNYRFYYSNENIKGNSSVALIKSDQIPKFINIDDLLVEKKGIFDSNSSFLEYVINKGINISLKAYFKDFDDDLTSLFSMFYRKITKKNFNDFLNYINKKYLKKEENNDIYYKHIGDDFYVKNYIGFKNLKSINEFENFDYNIFKRLFPNKVSAGFAIFCSIIAIANIIAIIYVFVESTKDDEKSCAICLQSVAIFIIFLGYLIYCWVIYVKVYKKDYIEILKSIDSDQIINNFLKELIEKLENKKLILYTIIFLCSSLLLQILGSILLYCSPIPEESVGSIKEKTIKKEYNKKEESKTEERKIDVSKTEVSKTEENKKGENKNNDSIMVKINN